jgi:hypothetical protein
MASGFYLSGDRFFYCFSESLTIYTKALKLLILHRGRSPTTAARWGAPASHFTGRLRWWPALPSDRHRRSKATRWKAKPRGARPGGGGHRRSNPLQPQSGRGSHGESPELSPGGGFYLATLSGYWRRESNSGGANHGEGQSTATGHRRRARDGIFFSLTLTVPWRPISVNLTEQIGAGFTLNFQWQLHPSSAANL